MWLAAVNQSLWSLSAVPSLGWTLYGVHLCGSLLSISLEADPKVFVRSIMKVIYYPLILSYMLSLVPFTTTLLPAILHISFGKMYAAYTLVCAVILLLEMKRLQSVPDMRVWAAARRERTHRRAGAGAGAEFGHASRPVTPSAPPLSAAQGTLGTRGTAAVTVTAPPPEIPFEYLRHLMPPPTTFDCSECPICMDDLCSVALLPHTTATASGTETGDVSGAGRATVSTSEGCGKKVTMPARSDLCLPCGHLYHEDCVLEWLREQSHCPSCRQAVSPTATKAVSLSLMQDVFL